MTINPASVEDMLSGGSAPAATWDSRPPHSIPVGYYYLGKVIREEVSQQTDLPKIAGGESTPAFWDAAQTRPKMQIILTLQNDGYVTDDNAEGHMRVFLKGGALQAAQATARDLGVKSFLHGDFVITWIGEKPPKTPGFNPAKVFKVDFTPGSAPAVFAALSAGSEGWAATPPQGAAAVAPPAMPAAVAAPAAPPAAPVAPPAPPMAAAPVAPPAQPMAAAPVAPPLPPAAPAADPASALMGILGATPVATIDPDVAAKVRAVYGAGYTTIPAIIEVFVGYGIPLTEAQVQEALGGVPM